MTVATSAFIHVTAIVEPGAAVGDGSRIWHHSHLRRGATVGARTSLGKNVYVDEGPQALVRRNRVFVVYSASGCWTDEYALGMLEANARANLMDASSWRKHPTPVFKAGTNVAGTFAAGHNSFFRSPDGKEDWILYHANSVGGQGCGSKRSPRAQPFTWTANGLPDFGLPVAAGVVLPIPSEGVKARTAASGAAR